MWFCFLSYFASLWCDYFSSNLFCLPPFFYFVVVSLLQYFFLIIVIDNLLVLGTYLIEKQNRFLSSTLVHMWIHIIVIEARFLGFPSFPCYSYTEVKSQQVTSCQPPSSISFLYEIIFVYQSLRKLSIVNKATPAMHALLQALRCTANNYTAIISDGLRGKLCYKSPIARHAKTVRRQGGYRDVLEVQKLPVTP